MKMYCLLLGLIFSIGTYVFASESTETDIKALKEKGVSDEKIAKVHSPIGLELQAETPEEIAVSILAEVLMVRDKGTGKSMKG